MKTGKNSTYHNVDVGIMPRVVELLDSAPQPAEVLSGAPGARRIDQRQLILPQAAHR
jgi:hypothetical protein